MSDTTVMVHLDLEHFGSPSVHTDSRNKDAYVWVNLNEHTRVCVRNRDEAARLIQLGVEIEHMLAGAAPVRGKLPGTLVERFDDDSPCPLVGEIISDEDDGHVQVAWRQDGSTAARTEALDELRPARERAR